MLSIKSLCLNGSLKDLRCLERDIFIRCSTDKTDLLLQGNKFLKEPILVYCFGHITKINIRGRGLSKNFPEIDFHRCC